MSGLEELGKAIEFIDRHPDDWNPLLTVRQAREWVVAAKTVRAALSGSTAPDARCEFGHRPVVGLCSMGHPLVGSTAPLDVERLAEAMRRARQAVAWTPEAIDIATEYDALAAALEAHSEPPTCSFEGCDRGANHSGDHGFTPVIPGFHGEPQEGKR